MGANIGLARKLYYHATPSTTDPTDAGWKLLTLVGDAQVQQTIAGKGDVINRGRTTVGHIPGLKEYQISGKLTFDLANAEFLALDVAFHAKTGIGAAACDQPIATSGTVGILGPFYLDQWNVGEPVQGTVEVDFVLMTDGRETVEPDRFVTP